MPGDEGRATRLVGRWRYAAADCRKLRKQLDSAGLSNVKISIAAAVTTIFDYAKVQKI